jgi:peptidoglycan/LPS O-acetylase OafA/YrhL
MQDGLLPENTMPDTLNETVVQPKGNFLPALWSSLWSKGNQGESGEHRIAILDGWRALSILLVLAGHLLPLGPKSWNGNWSAAATGMVLFFTLSGFLITRFLLARADVSDFLLRRTFRILPLAWLTIIVLTLVGGADLTTFVANFVFVANLPPQHLLEGGGHLWSLCVEMQFYVAVALLVALLGRRGLYLLPLICLAVTMLRVSVGAEIDIVTWLRVDEILAGATLALAYPRLSEMNWPRRLPSVTPLILLALLFASAHPETGALNYFRPYISAAVVGTSFFVCPALMYRLFTSRAAIYVAQTSYAVYVIHGVLGSTWLGTGDTLVRYLKRPLLIGTTFLAAHISTFYFEHPMIDLGKRIGRRRLERRQARLVAQ